MVSCGLPTSCVLLAKGLIIHLFVEAVSAQLFGLCGLLLRTVFAASVAAFLSECLVLRHHIFGFSHFLTGSSREDCGVVERLAADATVIQRHSG